MISLAAMIRASLADDAEDLVLAQDDVLDVVDLHFGPGVLADQNAVADLHFHGDALAVVIEPTGADRDHFPLKRLLFRGVGDDDAPLHLLFRFHPSDQNPVVEWLHFHRNDLLLSLLSALWDVSRALLALSPDECQYYRRQF